MKAKPATISALCGVVKKASSTALRVIVGESVLSDDALIYDKAMWEMEGGRRRPAETVLLAEMTL